jgi:hypothetical protein
MPERIKKFLKLRATSVKEREEDSVKTVFNEGRKRLRMKTMPRKNS